jgi:putative ATP-binding cassette transporter
VRLLLFLARSSRLLLACAVATSLIGGFVGASLVALINQALTEPAERIGSLAWKFAGLCLVVLVSRWLSQAQFVELSQKTLADLRSHLTRHFSEVPYRDLEARGSAKLLAVLSEDVSTVSHFFVMLPELVMHGAVVLGCLFYLGMLSWQVFLFALALVLLGSLGYHLAEVEAILALRRAREQEDELFRHFRALFDGAKELKLHEQRRREFVGEVIPASIAEVRRARTRGLAIYAGAASFGAFLFFFLIGSVLFGIGNWFPIDVHVMSGYALMFLYMMLPLEGVLGAIPSINAARVALERIDEAGGGAPERDVVAEGAATRAPQAPVAFEKLQLEGVTHRYHRETSDGVFTLGPIDLELAAGTLTYLVGGNGSGKTTLAKLVTGLYSAEGGRVLLNGKPVSRADRAAYLQQFSAVFSDFFLFDSLLGIDKLRRDERARELLVALELDHKLEISNGSFSTTDLSQGQRKRLALLVAYLEDRAVYVFDEWAADQDPTYKEIFYRKLLPELKARGKAVLVITHDDRYFGLADRRVKLEFGKLVPTSSNELAPLRERQAVLSV